MPTLAVIWWVVTVSMAFTLEYLERTRPLPSGIRSLEAEVEKTLHAFPGSCSSPSFGGSYTSATNSGFPASQPPVTTAVPTSTGGTTTVPTGATTTDGTSCSTPTTCEICEETLRFHR